MKITLSKRIGLLALLSLCVLALSTTAHAETNKLVAESSDSAQSRQRAAMEREQQNDMRNLRQRANKRTEKEWDKADAAFDNRDRCEQSANIDACWELSTLCCLGR